TDRQVAFAAGTDEYLTKPFEARELLRLLSSAESAEPARKDQPMSRAGAAGTSVKFWGVRGSIPTPGPGTLHYGGNTSCVEVRAAGQILILDAGTGLRSLGRALAAEFNGQTLDLTLLLT